MSPKTLDTSSARPLADDLHRPQRVRGQVGDEQVQLGAGDRGVGGVGPLPELVEVDPALADRRLQTGDDRLAIGVGGADDRRGRSRSSDIRSVLRERVVQNTVSASETSCRPAQVPP